MELCKKILKEDYEFVLATHIDRGHIHNHIFNNVNYKTGKCYQSNKNLIIKSDFKVTNYVKKISSQSLMNIMKLKKKYKTSGKSRYEFDQNKKGNS